MDLQDELVIATPEGVELTVVLAGIGSRGAAVAIDLAVQMVVELAVYFGLAISSAGSGVAIAVFLIVVFLMSFGYFVLFEAFADGRTPGKRLLGIRVVSADGGPLTFVRSLIRNLLRLIDQLPTGYLVGIVAVLATRRNQRLGDLAAGTLVVRDRRASDPASVIRRGAADASPRAWASPVAVAVALPPETAGWDLSRVTAEELAAARSFLDRRATLPPAIRQQLAVDFAQPLRAKVVGPPDDQGPERFLEWIVYVKLNRT